MSTYLDWFAAVALEDPWAWLITDLIHNKMVFWDTHFFLLVFETNRLVQAGQYCLVLLRYFLSTMIMQAVSHLISIHILKIHHGWDFELLKSTVKYWSWVLAMMSENHQCQTWYKLPCNSLTLLTKARVKRMQVPRPMFIQGKFHRLIWTTSKAL